MPAYISASPNPVVFSYPDIVLHHQHDVSVGWDTGDAAVKAHVFRSLNHGKESVLPGAAARNGSSAVQKIDIDQTLTFILRRSSDGQELARTDVTTQKDALATAMTDPDYGFIQALKIDVGVDTVGIAFQTKRAAIPSVEVRRKDGGALVDDFMGGSFGQVHAVTLQGFSGLGLPQDTALDVRIVALKDIGGGRVELGSGAHNPEVRGQVTTGDRTVQFHFDLIHVRNDGDPSGPGEFTFTFGVGDELSRQQLGPTRFWGEGEISSGGDRDVAQDITVGRAPRLMWATVTAWEDDSSIANPNTWGFGEPGIGPAYPLTRTDGSESDYGSLAWVGAHFNLTEAPGRQLPFSMSTGDFSIAFDVYGAMTVTERRGTNEFKGLALGRVQGTKRKLSERARAIGARLGGGRTMTFMRPASLVTVGLGPDGAVLLRTTDGRTGAASVTDLGGGFASEVTVLACSLPHEVLHLLGLTREGGVVARTVSPDAPEQGRWLELGGHFVGAVTAVGRGARVDVLARDAEGRVFHRLLSEDGAWSRSDAGVTSLAACGTAAGELVVFGLGAGGRVLHRRLDAEGWTPAECRWDEIARVDVQIASRGTIDVRWVTEDDLAVSVSTEDGLAGALLWRAYPRPDGDARWVPVEAAPLARAAGGADRDGGAAAPSPVLPADRHPLG